MVGHLRGHFKKKLLLSLVMVFAYLWLRDFFKKFLVPAVDHQKYFRHRTPREKPEPKKSQQKMTKN